MADPTPIQQIIKVLADTAGADEVQRALDGVKGATREGAEETKKAEGVERTREQRLTSIRQRLVELVREQDRYERQTKEGTEATEADRRAAERRERQIERLAGAMRDQQRIQQRVNDTIKGTSEESDKASFSMGSMVKGFAGLAGGVTAFGLLTKAVQLYREELENAAIAQGEAFRTQVTVASAERTLKLNLPGADDEVVQRAIDTARQIAEDNSVPIAQATSALASALSARGGNLDEAIAFTNLAARIRPDDPESIAKVAGALGDVSDATNIQDPTAALGFLLTVGGQSRVADFNQQAANIPAALAGIVGQDFSPADAGALFASLSIGAKDLTGDSTRTASIQLAEQINKFFEGQGRQENGSAAIAALQQDPALRAAFLQDLSLETRFRAPAASLLSDPQSSIAQDFSAFVPAYGQSPALRAEGERKLRQLGSGQLEANASLDRDLSAATDQLQANNITFGTVGAIRENLLPLLRQTGSSKLAARLSEAKLDLSEFNSSDEALDFIVKQLEREAQKTRERAIIVENLGEFSAEYRVPLNVDQRRQIETLNNAIRSIQERRGIEVGDQFIESGDQPIISNSRQLPDSLKTEIDDPNVRQADPSNPVVIQRQVINNGTIINNAGNPLEDDLDGRYR